ncbi:MAG: aldose epimerase family protein [Planctomycetota bacterium]|jgi:aldose 1-epimerase
MKAHPFILNFFMLLGLTILSGCGMVQTMSIKTVPFGEKDGKHVDLFILENENGLKAKITNYGGIVTEMHVPDCEGNRADVVLGFSHLHGYLEGHPYFGAIVGRVANRIGKGRFTLDGKEYTLATNNGPNHLHGGEQGFDKKLWNAEPFLSDDGPALKLTCLSPDGEEGYPGNLTVTVVYTLTQSDELKVEMTAETDKPTPVNLAHHSYWNLKGHDQGTILDHELMINADHYTPTDKTLIPTGELAPLDDTPYDFQEPKTIGRDIMKLPGNPASGNPGGYDVNFVLRGQEGVLKLAAKAYEPKSGRVLEVYTTEPGVQFYSGNFLDGTLMGKGGALYEKHQGFCLETQHFPDSINKPEWPSIVLEPGDKYLHVMIHKFSTE